MMEMTTRTIMEKVEAFLSASGLKAKELEAAARKIIADAAKKDAVAIGNEMQVKAAEPGVYHIDDARGLYLKKSSPSAGSYFFRYRFGLKRREMGLGSIADVPLADARKKARALVAQRDDGGDPIEARRQKKAKAVADADAAKKKVTFAQAAKTYLETHAPSWKHSGARSGWWNPIEKYALPVIGAKLLGDIVVEDVAAAMNAAVMAKAPVMARKVRASIEQVIDSGIALGQRDAKSGNPARLKLVKKVGALGKHRTKHYRRIELDDAPAAFRRLKELAATPAPTGVTRGPVPMTQTAFAAWVFMIATAARPTEAIKARWSEIDLTRGLWTLPDERMKGDKEHVVPLSSTALWALELMQVKRTSDAVFAGRGGASLSDNSFSEAAKKAGVDAGTPHSWRSIFRDWAGDVDNAPRELAEAALAHTLSAVEGAYRRGTAVRKRAPMMQRYADWLENDAPARVVPFPAKAS
jgi:integrase